jgi:hypothetical protein
LLLDIHFIYFIFGGIGVWTWGLLLGRHYTTWTTLPAQFCEGYFPDKVFRTICLRLASNYIPPDLCLLSS